MEQIQGLNCMMPAQHASYEGIVQRLRTVATLCAMTSPAESEASESQPRSPLASSVDLGSHDADSPISSSEAPVRPQHAPPTSPQAPVRPQHAPPTSPQAPVSAQHAACVAIPPPSPQAPVRPHHAAPVRPQPAPHPVLKAPMPAPPTSVAPSMPMPCAHTAPVSAPAVVLQDRWRSGVVLDWYLLCGNCFVPKN